MDSRLLWTLFLVPIEEKTSIVDKKYPISEKKHNFLTKLSDCSVMMCEANCRKNTTVSIIEGFYCISFFTCSQVAPLFKRGELKIFIETQFCFVIDFVVGQINDFECF